ncbi:hypothetical protein pdul_cds_668 [Pandoravirus dulcis]|uniref:Uncharacterized protein n=1 Tax=Pandoravirus dulcis TaxID=1349409 RepID=S4VTR8_9VIRU|nr:hypothetical protein pdul_cds_668 [Pandoravirus dulcis]AGO82815.1 hypothetical protein pdul_cds_668 [Pandoravirus dulcis]
MKTCNEHEHMGASALPLCEDYTAGDRFALRFDAPLGTACASRIFRDRVADRASVRYHGRGFDSHLDLCRRSVADLMLQAVHTKTSR